METVGPIYSHKIITMERGLRDRYVDESRTSAKNLGLEYEAEKRDLQKLNNSFTLYLARVKQMEMANKSLEDALKELRDRWGFGTAEIREQKDKELEDLRTAINSVEAAKDLPQIRARSAEYSADIIKGKINFLNELANCGRQRFKKLENQKVLSAEELEEWIKRNSGLEDELAKLRNVLQESLKQLEGNKNELDFATMERMDLENKVQTLRDQMAFLQAVQEAELLELQDMIRIDFDTGTFYKRELTKAIDDIRRDFNTLSDAQRDHIGQYYESRIEEVRNQVIAEEKELEEAKSSGQVEIMNIGSLKESIHNMNKEKINMENEHNGLLTALKDLEQKLYEMQSIKQQKHFQQDGTLARLSEELQSLQDKLRNASDGNVSLKFEINTYRRLLEMQEKQLTDASSDMVTSGQVGGLYSQSHHGYGTSMSGAGGATTSISSYSSAGASGSSAFTAGGAGMQGGNFSGGSGFAAGTNAYTSGQGALSSGLSGVSTPSNVGGRMGSVRTGGMGGGASGGYSTGDQHMYMQSDVSGGSDSYGGATGMATKGMADFSGSLSNYHRICSLRQSIGDISIEDIDQNDRFVSLKNTSNDEVDIGGYEIDQQDGYGTNIKYEIPLNIRIRPQAILRIFSKSAARYASPDDMVSDTVNSWLNAASVTTLLFKPNGEKTAELVMRPSYP